MGCINTTRGSLPSAWDTGGGGPFSGKDGWSLNSDMLQGIDDFRQAQKDLKAAASDMYEALDVCLAVLYEVEANKYNLLSNIGAAIITAEKAMAKAEGRRG